MAFEEGSTTVICILSWHERSSCPVRDPSCCLRCCFVASRSSWPWVCKITAILIMCELNLAESTTACPLGLYRPDCLLTVLCPAAGM